MAIVETGYLETAYLSAFPYMSGQIENGLPTQVDMRIVDEDDDPHLLTQVDMRIVDETDDPHLFTQVDMALVGETKNLSNQVDMKRLTEVNLNTQVEMRVTDKLNALNMQVKIGKLAHFICDGYLQTFPYLTDPYLTTRMCAQLYTQVEMKILNEENLNTQVDQRIVDETDDPHLNTQVSMKVFDQSNVNTQVNMLKSTKLNTSVNMVIYNNTQFRLLCEFASRGTAALGGINWTSVQPIAAGDFSPNNLNTDIIEQRTQTDGVVALWQLRCNTGNPNTFADTFAILNHNFTKAATVEIAGSDDAGFGTIKFTYNMTTEEENMYFISPSLPNIPAQYYQFTIQDVGNPAGFLSIGTIVFGSATIMTPKEWFTNPVSYGKRHFKDTLETEGFTSVSNDRAIRRFLSLTFSQLERTGGNFGALQDYICTAKTDLKCLIIPRPTVPSALAVFAKLSQLPEELHNAIDDDNWRIDMTFDWDESL